jgi:hypothetical protein
MSSNIHIEFNAIKKLMEDRNPELLIAIDPAYLGNIELRKMFMLLRKFYVDNGEFMGFDVLKGYVSKACTTPEKTKFMMGVLSQIQERDVSGLTDEILLKDLRDYHKFRMVLGKTEPLIAAVESKDIDQTLGRLKELYDSVFVDAEYKLENADMSAMAGKKVKFDFRSTGIKPLDDRGGLILGGYTIIAAPAKAGKSTLTSMIALHQYLHEEGSVAIFSYEMGAEEVRARILANFSDVDLGAIMADELSDLDALKLLTSEAIFYCGEGEDKAVVKFCRDNYKLSREAFFPLLFEAFPKRSNKFYIFDERENWDDLFVKMNLLASTKNVRAFIVDYPFLINRGQANSQLASWEYHLLQSKNLKTFSHKYGANVITPAQLDPGKKGEDPRLKFMSNILNDCDLALYLTETDEDKTLGTVTVKWGAMRNFKTIPGKPFLEPFRLMKELNKSRFTFIEF